MIEIEKILKDYLEGRLSVPVCMESPEQSPDSFVALEKTGSSCENFIFRSTFTVQSYGPSLLEATRLNKRVKAAMDGLSVLDEIGAARLNSDYNFTDTTTKRYRYQAVYEITHY